MVYPHFQNRISAMRSTVKTGQFKQNSYSCSPNPTTNSEFHEIFRKFIKISERIRSFRIGIGIRCTRFQLVKQIHTIVSNLISLCFTLNPQFIFVVASIREHQISKKKMKYDKIVFILVNIFNIQTKHQYSKVRITMNS